MSEEKPVALKAEEENKLIAERREKLDRIREKRNAFPNDFRREDYAADLENELGQHEKPALETLNRTAKVAGRIMAKRGPFIVLQDSSGRIQLYVDKKQLPESVLEDINLWDIGDIVCGAGPVHKSGKGDLYVYLQEAQLLTKSLRPLPDKHHGLTDTETRYRQRYVDLIVNESSRTVFEIRVKVIDAMRSYLKQQNFMEVETPMMHVIPGGAAAKPFVTHHNALDMDLYLRIAPELYLKRLVVGGFERVFEINRNFRNEGLSTRHNPEFTMIEMYQAYADYQDMMNHTENMLRYVAEQALGSTTFTCQGHDYDFSKPFQRISVFDSILQFNPHLTAENISTLEAATKTAEALSINVKKTWGLGKVQIEIFEATVEEKLIQPTFITQYPTEVSP